MKSVLLIFFLLLIASFTVVIADDSVNGNSQKAIQDTSFPLIHEEELSKRLQFYRSISTLTVNFKQVKVLNDLQVKLKSEGRLKLIRPDQVIWEITKPSRVLVKFNQKEIRIETGEGTEYSVQTLKISDIPKDRDTKSISGLVAWLQLDARALSQQYLISSLGPKKFRFKPKEQEDSPFQSLEMTLASTGHLENLVIYETSGDEIDIQFGVPTIVR